jgi:hypothetical protein
MEERSVEQIDQKLARNAEAIHRFNDRTKPRWPQKIFISALMLYGFLIAWNWLPWPWVIGGFLVAVTAPALILMIAYLPRAVFLQRKHMRLLAQREKLVSTAER